jgi:hypothetical protein
LNYSNNNIALATTTSDYNRGSGNFAETDFTTAYNSILSGLIIEVVVK